ncbi:MAG: Asp23/Gls24 family envelope stress response protein [Candidatus Enteromonas sp.]|nr:Asp23/Gls24 family envelope stress response protein [Candidatus Enteromonas sp.]
MPYLEINNYSSNGKMGISLDAINTIATRAVNEVEGAAVYQNKKGGKGKEIPFRKLFELTSGVSTTLTQGKAVVRINVSISKESPVSDICLAIQKRVSDDIHLACDAIPTEIRIKVVELV